MMDSYLTKPTSPKNGDKYKTKDGDWVSFRYGRWVKIVKKK